MGGGSIFWGPRAVDRCNSKTRLAAKLGFLFMDVAKIKKTVQRLDARS